MHVVYVWRGSVHVWKGSVRVWQDEYVYLLERDEEVLGRD